MVKGVNRQVLEIHDTGCDYFEKALFFVRPEYSAENEARLKKGALKTIQRSAQVPRSKRQKMKSRLFFVLEMLSAAGTGAAIAAAIIR